VPYRDKMDDEWELFQKSMKEETVVSIVLLRFLSRISKLMHHTDIANLYVRPSARLFFSGILWKGVKTLL